MSIWPFLSVSLPRDHPVRYLEAGFSILAEEISQWVEGKIGTLPSLYGARFPR